MSKAAQPDAGNAPKGGYQRSEKRESAASAVVQVAVALIVVGVAVFFYARAATEKEHVATRAKQAMEAALGDDAFALLKAKALYAEAGDELRLAKNDTVLANMAELEAQLVQSYGIAAERPHADRLLALAKDRDVKKAERYAAEAYLLIADGKPVEAEKVITALTDRGVRHPKVLHALSVAKLAQGKAKEAQVAAEEGMKLSSQLARLPIAQGDALLDLGNYAAAYGAYKKALQINGDHLRARTAINLTQGISRAAKPALLLKDMDTLLEDATTRSGGTPPPRVAGFIHYVKGEIFLVDNQAQAALAQVDKALASDPSQAPALGLKGRALAKLGKLDDAKKAFTDALALAPTSLPIARAAAETLGRAGKAQEGLAFVEKVREANPDNGLVYVHLALAQARAGKAKEAMASATTALDKLGNAHELALFAKGRALRAEGALDKARETYLEAITARGNSDWPELFDEMGHVRLAEKNWDDAVATFEQAIRLYDKLGGANDDVAAAYDGLAKAYEGIGKKKAKEAKDASDKAAALRAQKS